VAARRRSTGIVWWSSLIAAICLEGLGRRFLPIPGPVLYFAKDLVLVSGLIAVGLHPAVAAMARRLAGPLPVLVAATAAWCLVSLLIPGHPSVPLGLLGTRQYVLWWVAPLIVATALRDGSQTDHSERLLGVLAIGIAAVAAYQFEQPPSAAINAYAWGDGPGSVAAVTSTGRVRVTSTFSYISGFADFVILAVPILLAAAVSPRGARSSRIGYVAAGCLAATAAMSGARATVLYVAAGSLAVLGLSGSFRTRRGMLAFVAIVLVAAAGVWAVPEASQGVQDRFGSEDTGQRFRDLALAIPVYAILHTDFPPFGAGVGVLQNAGATLQFESGWAAEAEPQRLLIELGLPGYLLVWLSRLFLAVALVRAARMLSRAGERGWAGAAWTYAGFVFLLPLTTDHVAQALFFVGVGLMLARLLQVQSTGAAPTWRA
jgi:hypothetical protein